MLQLPGTGPPTLPVGSELTDNNALGLRGSVIATMEAFNTEFGVSKAANGYQKLPSGIIIQWGTASQSVAASISNSLPVTLPIAFPTAHLATIATLRTAATGSRSIQIVSQPTNLTSLTIFADSGAAQAVGYNWFSIGH